MDQIQEIFEFPVTIPNQARVESVIRTMCLVNVISSFVIGYATDSLVYLSAAFAIQFAVLVALVSTNVLFKGQPGIEWLSVKY
ncbi:uncharacterized protein LODBEIA_P52860 [Lodderomyces beijingensis]|uniref:ER membrane protein complex subunit 6 n=1 Tax=Lodderomyces beijingensis TaxID=1775926 RepID=A0ABP0ZUP7_9ASCO